MPRANDLLTTVEGCAAALATRRQVDDAHTRHEMTVDDIKHLTLVGSDDTILQFDVIVVTLQLQDALLALFTYHSSHLVISLERCIIAPFGQDILRLFHIVIERGIRIVSLIGLHLTIRSDVRQVHTDGLHMLRINGFAFLFLVLLGFQLRLKLIENTHIIELVLIFLLVEFKEWCLVGIIRKRRDGQGLVRPA